MSPEQFDSHYHSGVWRCTDPKRHGPARYIPSPALLWFVLKVVICFCYCWKCGFPVYGRCRKPCSLVYAHFTSFVSFDEMIMLQFSPKASYSALLIQRRIRERQCALLLLDAGFSNCLIPLCMLCYYYIIVVWYRMSPCRGSWRLPWFLLSRARSRVPLPTAPWDYFQSFIIILQEKRIELFKFINMTEIIYLGRIEK